MERELKTYNSKIEQINQIKREALTSFLNKDIPKEEYDNFITFKNDEMKQLMSSKIKLESALSTSLDTNTFRKYKRCS